MLGARGVDMLAWELFGEGWVTDVQQAAEAAECPHASRRPMASCRTSDQVNFDNDVVFTWNGTTSGVRVPNADWIPADRKGLTICDATSAAFAQNLDFAKLDVVTFSWQKALGGEAAHGILILSPRAVERLETYKPDLAAAEDFPHDQGRQAHGRHLRGRHHQHRLDALHRGRGRCDGVGQDRRRPQGHAGPRRCQLQGARRLGGEDRRGSISSPRTQPSGRTPRSASSSPIPAITALDDDAQAAFAKAIVSRLDKAGVAYDIGHYRDAPTGFRIWAARPSKRPMLEALTPWLDYAFAPEKAALAKAAA